MSPATYFAHAARIFRAGEADPDVVDPLALFALNELAQSMDALASTYSSGASDPARHGLRLVQAAPSAARPLAALKDPA